MTRRDVFKNLTGKNQDKTKLMVFLISVNGKAADFVQAHSMLDAVSKFYSEKINVNYEPITQLAVAVKYDY